MLNSGNLLQDLFHLPNNAVIGIINDSDKRVWITHTSSTGSFLARFLSELELSTHKHPDLAKDKAKLRIEVLGTSDFPEYRKIHVEYWMLYYKELGYELYSKYIPLKYRVRIRTVTHNAIITPGNHEAIVRNYVELVNRRGEAFVVGVFRLNTTATKFVQDYYSNQLVLPIIATNRLTRKYFREYKELDVSPRYRW